MLPPCLAAPGGQAAHPERQADAEHRGHHEQQHDALGQYLQSIGYSAVEPSALRKTDTSAPD